MKLARDLLDTLSPRWKPQRLPTIAVDDNDGTQDGWICFPPALTTAETTKDIFRIFTENELEHETIPNIEPEPGHPKQ